MGLRSNFAAVTNAQTMLLKEECALDMGQSSADMNALLKGAQTKFSVEECVSSTGQNTKDAAVKGVPNKPSAEECVEDMGHIAVHTTHLLHLGQNLNSLLQLKS